LALYGIQGAVADRLVPALTGGTVYTDDLAPVEWLTDLLDPALRHRRPVSSLRKRGYESAL
jgi:hypothetical protein